MSHSIFWLSVSSLLPLTWVRKKKSYRLDSVWLYVTDNKKYYIPRPIGKKSTIYLPFSILKLQLLFGT